jgi:hypothetical protein
MLHSELVAPEEASVAFNWPESRVPSLDADDATASFVKLRFVDPVLTQPRPAGALPGLVLERSGVVVDVPGVPGVLTDFARGPIAEVVVPR